MIYWLKGARDEPIFSIATHRRQTGVSYNSGRGVPLTRLQRSVDPRSKHGEAMKVARIGFAAAMFFVAHPVAAQMASDVQRGFTLVRTHCAQCHSIDGVGASPLPAAPPFRDLHNRYPVETLAEGFAEGITTGHPSMPEFRFEPDEIDSLIAFLKSLE